MNTAHEPLRLGILGGALDSAVGRTHHIACQMDGWFRIEAGCFSQRAEMNEATARFLGVAPRRRHADWRTLLEAEKGRLDAVLVLTPTPAHAEMVVAALGAGHAVICEKAMACTVAESAAIRAAQTRNNGFLAVTYNYTGYPMVRELRHMIADGRLGRLLHVHVEMPQEGFIRLGADGKPPRPQAWRLSDGEIPTVSLDLGVHVHQLVRFLCDVRPLEAVATEQRFGHHAGLVDHVSAMVRYSGGVAGHVWYGKAALGHANGLRIRVFGTQGSAEWYQMDPETLRVADATGHVQALTRAANGIQVANLARYNRFKAGHPAGFIEAFANLYEDISLALRGAEDKTGETMVSGVEAADEGLRLLHAFARSAREKRWCEIQ